MKTTIDSAGRVVIPRKVREAARIEPGTELEVTVAGDIIELRPIPGTVRLKKAGKLLVAFAGEDAEKLSQSRVNETLEDVRARHLPRSRRRTKKK